MFGARELAEYLALVHDVGKGSCAWQSGLLRAEAGKGRVVDEDGGSIDHKLAGTRLAAERLGIFALAVLGHHGGLDNPAALNDKLAVASGDRRPAVDEAISRVADDVPEIRPEIRPRLPAYAQAGSDPLVAELLLRMAFSALADADFLDTERHFTGTARPVSESLSALSELFDANRERYLARRPSSPVDPVRAAVYDEAVAAADQDRGVFPFASPTGSGKTIASMGFAVRHARRHGLRRVVVAVPYLSITEQNAAVYRRLFGDRHVLEHHSGVDLHDLPPDRRWQLLASENWDAPVVVTTTVQLFESLFARTPSAMRKLHRLAGSVIVLDEVQSLPDQLLPPILSALRHLTEHFGASVVLASATQPDFFGLEVFQSLRPRPLVAQPKPLYDRLRRVGYDWRPGEPTFAEVATEGAASEQALMIVNTTRDAAELHTQLIQADPSKAEQVFHLSTRMASQHRRDVLTEIRRRLHPDVRLPVLVASTQLVEAGVDLDFPVVYRAFAPAEALQQAAGRANRNGALGEGAAGRVVVFEPSDGSTRATRMIYGTALGLTRNYFGEGKADPDDLEALQAYYEARYTLDNVEKSSTGAAIQSFREEFDFVEVAKLFKMINELTVPVLVPYGDEEERQELRRLLLEPGRTQPQVWRAIQPYLAMLPRDLGDEAVEGGYAEVLIEGTAGPRHRTRAGKNHDGGKARDVKLLEWTGDYHAQRGIEITLLEERDFVW